MFLPSPSGRQTFPPWGQPRTQALDLPLYVNSDTDMYLDDSTIPTVTFLNDLPLYVNSDTDIYLDDSTIHTSAEELNVKLTEDMANVHTWFTNNNMVINHTKTKAMTISTYQHAATLNSDLHVEFTGKY
jgi:hypothetical protein